MKPRIILIILAVLLSHIGCASLKKPATVIDKIIQTPSVYIESLKHPTKFPVEHLPEVFDIEEILKQNPLGEEEAVKILLIGESKLASTHFVQVRKDAEIKTHYHKTHDETVHVKKGKGIAILNGTRYLVQPGTVLQIPGNTRCRFINTGGELCAAVSVFTPPFDGKDIVYVKEEKGLEQVSEAEKEMKREEKAKKVRREKDKLAAEKNKGDNIEAGNINKKGAGGLPEEMTEVKETPTTTPESNEEYSDDKYIYGGDQDILDYSDYETKTNTKKGLDTGRKDAVAAEEMDTAGEEEDEIETDLDKHLFGSPDEADVTPFVYEKEEDLLNNSRHIQDKVSGKDYKDATEYTRDKYLSDTDEIFMKDTNNLEDRLKELNELRTSNLITEDDYQSKKAELSGIDDR